MRYKHPGNDHVRAATYDTGAVIRCPKASVFGYAKSEACAGDIIEYALPSTDGGKIRFQGRVIGRVTAPRLGEKTPAVRNHIAVMELASAGAGAYIRWIDPKDVVMVRPFPTSFLQWFGQSEMPHIDDILRLDQQGALSDLYIAKYAPMVKAARESKEATEVAAKLARKKSKETVEWWYIFQFGHARDRSRHFEIVSKGWVLANMNTRGRVVEGPFWETSDAEAACSKWEATLAKKAAST